MIVTVKGFAGVSLSFYGGGQWGFAARQIDG